MGQENEIVFEDLHGVNEDEPVTVDLDAASKDDGITRTPDDQSAGDDATDDDSIEIDGLRSADVDDDESLSADTQTDDDDDASKGSEDDDYSKKVKARIGRERRAKRKAQQEAGYWKSQAEKLAKDQYESDKTKLKGDIEQADAQIENTQTLLEAAIEDGKTKDQVRLTTELNNQTAVKVRSEVALENLSESGNVQPFDDKVAAPKAKDQSKADQWMEDRVDWYGAKGFERQTRLANRLDKEVYREGYEPTTDEYFEELDRRIKEAAPELYDDAGSTADDPPTRGKRPTRSPVAPVGGNETRRQSTSSSKVELGESDFANMRRFGMDPKDPNVLREYAANKREADQGDQR